MNCVNWQAPTYVRNIIHLLFLYEIIADSAKLESTTLSYVSESAFMHLVNSFEKGQEGGGVSYQNSSSKSLCGMCCVW